MLFTFVLGPKSLRELFDTLRVIGPSPSLLNPLSLVADDSRSVLAVKGSLRRFAPWTAAGRSEGMAVYEGKGGGRAVWREGELLSV